MADVKVAGKEKIGAAVRHSLHCQSRSSDQMPLIMSLRQIEWMMRDNYLDAVRTGSGKFLLHPADLLFVDASTFNRQRAGGVDSEHGDLFVMIKGPQVVRDVITVLA